MLAELAGIFAWHQLGGEVVFKYEVQVFYGCLEPRSV
jgi:hypothetical protein